MPITIAPKLSYGKKQLDQVIRFHQSDKPSVFYQEILSPFLLMLMTVNADRPKDTYMSVYTPDAQFALSYSDSIQGRREQSQHQHNCFEFTYVIDGSMYQIVEGKRYFYPAGSCCLMNRNTLHTEELSTDFFCLFFTVSSDFVARLMNYGNSLLFPDEQHIFDNLIFRFFERNLQDSTADSKDFLDFIPKITETQQVQLVHQIFEDMLHTLIQPSSGATYRLQELFMQLIAILADPTCYNAVHITAKSNMESSLFARIDQILEERHGRITHAELAEKLSYNGSYLGRIVKKYTGKSLFDYSVTFTMKYAAQQLLETKKTAAQIAAELQFSNRSHFYHLFKRHFGVTPKHYRSNAKLQ
ncbi:MAG: helix-turn-helix domain-containing protein [Oscillospiraceae bacterium]|nr:helix-turn-helix domain-containing protein [Oscillospiraceae bacterium]